MFSPAKERLLEELNSLEDTLVAFQAFFGRDQNQASRTTLNQLLKEIQEDEQER